MESNSYIENIEAGNKFWFYQMLGEHHVVLYFGKLSSVINKIDPMLKTAMEFSKIYIFDVMEQNNKHSKTSIYSKDFIYSSYGQIIKDLRSGNIDILFSWSAAEKLTEEEFKNG